MQKKYNLIQICGTGQNKHFGKNYKTFLNNFMDDDLDPKEDIGEEVDDFDDDLILGKGKPKKGGQNSSHDSHDEDPIESLDALADEEDGLLPEDSFDDEDLW